MRCCRKPLVPCLHLQQSPLNCAAGHECCAVQEDKNPAMESKNVRTAAGLGSAGSEAGFTLKPFVDRLTASAIGLGYRKPVSERKTDLRI